MKRGAPVDRSSIGPDTILRLALAAEIAFPGGTMTASGLRRERDRGKLTVWKIAGKEFTSLAEIQEMMKRCVINPARRPGAVAARETIRPPLRPSAQETATAVADKLMNEFKKKSAEERQARKVARGGKEKPPSAGPRRKRAS